MRRMRKDVAIGLSVIGVLLAVFLGVLYMRLARRPSADAPLVAAAKPPTPIREQSKPIVVAAREESAADEVLRNQDWADHGSPAAQSREPANSKADFNPRASYMPAADEQTYSEPAEQAALTSAEEPVRPESRANDWSAAPATTDAEYSPESEADAQTSAAKSEVSSQAEPQQSYTDEIYDQQPDATSTEPTTEHANPLRARAPSREAGDAIPAAATMAEEPARPGFRSQIPREEYPGSTDELLEQQPAQMPHAHARDFGAAPPARVEPDNGKYAVQPNDNFWSVAQKVYGDGSYFKAIQEHNRLRFPRPDKLQVGDVLDVPPVAVLHERYAELCPKQRRGPAAKHNMLPASTRHRAGERVYVVSEGDTLFDIAKFELGKASRWAEIYDLNREVLSEDFDYLRPGTELVLPHQPREAESVTRSTSPNLQR